MACKFDSLVEHVADECPLCNPDDWMAESRPAPTRGDLATNSVRVPCVLNICRECKQPAIVQNGVLQTRSSFFMNGATPTLTPHTAECTATD